MEEKNNGVERELNRLIIVGNGFDLAHGLKTSYNDFILDYIINCFNDLDGRINTSYKDEVFEITCANSFYSLPVSGFNSIPELITNLYRDGKINDLFKATTFYNNGFSLMNIYKIRAKMPFIQHIIGNCSFTNWVDIENEFYERLKAIVTNPLPDNKVHELQELNTAMKWLCELLEKYLSKQTNDNYNDAFMKLMLSKVEKEDFADKEFYTSQKITINDTLVLNFNYTSTVENYLFNSGELTDGVTINYIHGQLNVKKNPIIFGFGDELDDDYVKLELDKTKGIFEYIKSFWYFKTSNYYSLIRFIDTTDYQVFILGHSCGLSDRTMLNMIFEHANCRSIKIFYHKHEGETNFTALTQEISRHFKDKPKMRRKIVSLDRSSAMPQAWD